MYIYTMYVFRTLFLLLLIHLYILFIDLFCMIISTFHCNKYISFEWAGPGDMAIYKCL